VLESNWLAGLFINELLAQSMSCWRRAQAIAGDLDLPEGDTLGRRAGGMQGSGQV
jgi:hypothetical protein